MARWKVTAKHYAYAEQYGQPTEWERQETNVDTGRMFRKTFKVPLYIDPDDKNCINQHEGFCVVARKGSEKPGDIILLSDITPDMEPMDDEARAETEANKHKWINPIEGLAPEIGQDFGKKLLEMFERQMDQAASVTLKSAKSNEMDELKAMVLEQQKQIQALLNAKATPETEPVPDDLEPLPADGDPSALPKAPPIVVDKPRASIRR